MARDLLIDGYNLMHAVGLARRRYGPGDLERCRDRLLKWLARNLSERERLRATIVFDAKEVHAGQSLAGHFRGMTVWFAAKEAEADDLIEELIETHSSPRQLLVVSGDRRLQRAARRRRAKAVDSERFHAELTIRAEVEEEVSRRPDPKRDAAISESEMAAWLAAFGDVRPDEIRKEVERERSRARPAAVPKPSAPAPPPGNSQPSASPRPLSRRPLKVRPAPSQHNGSDDASREKTASEPLAGDEVDFWEQRIADLFDEEGPAT
ncbi:YacP-like NYN domain protein [Maioricimonas rarisocia]|uniref:YacP-like NYN domain protein n=1 Tax=Maioricimonas rarisocia TaxID=2528026 RepID=A0A517Z1Y6_9PLAN|nr:NYN domain-containing protein [Maioricimonas rarisocia]QDU36475.1 YacP-like NYN domain protein [Maioricimonas rarisocia]